MNRHEYNVSPTQAGLHGVVDENGALVADGFATNESAWRWIDKHSDEGLADTERVRRIRTSARFSEGRWR